jgi:hypothetical protein
LKACRKTPSEFEPEEKERITLASDSTKQNKEITQQKMSSTLVLMLPLVLP